MIATPNAWLNVMIAHNEKALAGRAEAKTLGSTPAVFAFSKKY
jgi:hypothetical protein